jgi:toxin ParE1/3/4
VKVIYAQTALNDLTDYYFYLSAQTTSTFAASYIEKIQDFCDTLSKNPERGTLRKIGAREIRFIVFRRRIIVAYRMRDDVVTIMNVLNKGRNELSN